MNKIVYFAIGFFGTLFLAYAAFAAPAFPGAQGGGAISVGGRGGAVIPVTNLNDSGTGSLRACVQASGPRTCVFRTGGTILLLNPLIINNPFITIAGQTAPGGGIQLRGTSLPNSSEINMVEIHTHDIVMSYIRLRVGVRDGGWSAAETGRNLLVLDGYNMIFDHISSEWNYDDNLSIWGHSTVTNWTTSNSILAEPISHPSGKCMIIGANGSTLLSMKNIDVHHSYFSTCPARSPYISVAESKVVANIIYNWGAEAGTMLRGGVKTDVVGNLFRGGPISDTGSNPDDLVWFPYASDSCEQSTYCIPDPPSLYVVNNTFTPNGQQTDPSSDNWPQTRGWSSTQGYFSLPTSYKRASALAADTYPISFGDPRQLPTQILPTVGDSQRLDCSGNWVGKRDSVDTRLVNAYASGTGQTISDQSQVGGYPTLSAGTACADSDNDGMPDAYELANGLNPNNAADRNADNDGDGFTNLEEYLTGLPAGPGADTTAPSVPSNLSATAVSTSQINLTWTASTDNVGVTGYLVESCQGASCSNYAQIATPTTTSYNNTGLAANTTYRYRVRATDAANNLSGYSSIASATTQAGADTTAPTIPTGLTATAASQTQIDLVWNASTDNVAVTGYNLHYANGAFIASIWSSAGQHYSDTGLNPGTQYSYYVTAYDAAGNISGPSTVASATTQGSGPGPDTTPPTPPTGLTATAISPTQVNLTWNASTDNVGVTTYNVFRVSCTYLASTGNLAYSNTGLAPNTTYSYYVIAYDAANNASLPSGAAVVTTPAQ